MLFSIPNRALLRGMIAGGVVLASASACSSSDRADRTGDASQENEPAVVSTDTGTATATQPTITDTARNAADTLASPETASRETPAPRQTSPEASVRDSTVAGYRAMRNEAARAADTAAVDTASAEMSGATPSADTSLSRTDSVALGDSAAIGKPGERLETTGTSEQANADSLANQPESDRVRPPEDSSEILGVVTGDTVGDSTISNTAVPTDTTEMVRDTTTALAQADTTGPANPDTLSQTSPDTVTIQARVDTSTAGQQPQVSVESPADTATALGDSAAVDKAGERLEANAAAAEGNADTLATESERVRPPEDSTEVLGNVTNEDTKAEEVEVSRDEAQVGAAGVASTGNMATGAAAVGLLTRTGQRCTVSDTDESREEDWDMANSPATMNPCGTGTMTLPRIQTGEQE